VAGPGGCSGGAIDHYTAPVGLKFGKKNPVRTDRVLILLLAWSGRGIRLSLAVVVRAGSTPYNHSAVLSL